LPQPNHQDIVAALQEPGFYPHPVDRVDFIQTHISAVFLTGGLVYKLKKPVDFGFLDFTSLEKRRHYCQEELRLNRRLAPSVYLRVEPINWDGARLSLGGPGQAVDYVVVMRQLQARLMGLEVLARGELGPGHIRGLVELLAPFYQQAATGPGVDEHGGLETVRFNTEENFQQTEAYVGLCLSRERFEEIRDYTRRFLEENRDLLARRAAQGRIRECHGDLHLANICFEDPPVVFDCIEFNERFRCSDVAADLAFLAMDLDFQGLPDLSRLLIEGYVARSGDKELIKLIDFYKCYRAYVRAKIHSFTFDDPGVPGPAKAANLELARRYFALAQTCAGGLSRPALVVVYGLMGTGKSALGRWLHTDRGWLVLRSDAVRKMLSGLPQRQRVHQPFNQGLYSPEMSARTYAHMFERAEGFLRAGQSIVLDASFHDQARRREAAELAGRCGARLLFLQTVCRPEEQRRRLEERQAGASTSDGRVEIMAAQAAAFEPAGPAEDGRRRAVATDGPKEATRALAEAALREHGLAG